jgi:hypothetical protein
MLRSGMVLSLSRSSQLFWPLWCGSLQIQSKLS